MEVRMSITSVNHIRCIKGANQDAKRHAARHLARENLVPKKGKKTDPESEDHGKTIPSKPTVLLPRRLSNHDDDDHIQR